jgi:hypothetical protein
MDPARAVARRARRRVYAAFDAVIGPEPATPTG